MGNHNTSESPEKYLTISEGHFSRSEYKSFVYYRIMFIFRLMQDTSCYIDQSLRDNINIDVAVFPPQFKLKESEYSKFIKDKEFILEIWNDVKFNTINDKLEDPYWVMQFAIPNVCVSIEQINLIPQNQWKEIRLKTLDTIISAIV